MDGSSPELGRDRPFDPSKTVAGEASRALVADVLHRIESSESRQRARREADQRNFELMVSAIVLDLAHCVLVSPKDAVAVPLQNALYTAKTRPAPFLMETFPSLVRQLAKLELLDLEMGRRSPFGPGKRSTVRASHQLLRLLEKHGVAQSDIGLDPRLRRRDVLVLKGSKVRGKASKLVVPDTEETRRLRHDMQEINAWLATADLEWLDSTPIDVSYRFLRRIFNNGHLDQGGRLYGGFWQGLNAEARLNYIWIDGHAVSSLDFGQMAVRTAYSLVGVEPPTGDLYSVPRLEQYREGVKKVLNALLAADKMPNRFPQGTRAQFPRSYKLDDVVDPILAHHRPIARLFGTGRAHQLMHIESNLMVSILLQLKELGIVGLPIHDCLLVSQKYSRQVKQVMEDSFRQMLGWEGVVEESLPTVTITIGTPSASLLRGA